MVKDHLRKSIYFGFQFQKEGRVEGMVAEGGSQELMSFKTSSKQRGQTRNGEGKPSKVAMINMLPPAKPSQISPTEDMMSRYVSQLGGGNLIETTMESAYTDCL